MFRYLLTLFVALHGLVHLWYFVLSQRLVGFRPEMGWTGRSWLFTPLLGDAATRAAAGVGYLLATVAFLASGIGLLARLEWWRPLLMVAATFSASLIVLMWDGSRKQLVEKGLIGALISAAILAIILLK